MQREATGVDRRRFLRGGLTGMAAGAMTYAAPKVAAAAASGGLSPGALPFDVDVAFVDVTSALTGDFSGAYRSSGGFNLAVSAQQSCVLSGLSVQAALVSGEGFGAFTVQQTSPVEAACSPEGSTLHMETTEVNTVVLGGCTVTTSVTSTSSATLGSGGFVVRVMGTINVKATCTIGSLTRTGSFSIPFKAMKTLSPF